MGTPDFATVVLSSLLDAGHDVVGVYTQPDRPRGRGRQTAPAPVKRQALELGLPVYQPTSLRSRPVYDELASRSPDLIAVAAYGRLLPSAVLDLPPLGCLNVHPSLLPMYRGASPVAAAILNGDEVTGVTLMKVDAGMDTGPIIAQKETPIGPDENVDGLTTRLFEMGAELLVEVLPKWQRGELKARAQDESRASVTRRLTREDGRIDWQRAASDIARQVRAYYPWPGTFTSWRGRMLKITEASVAEGTAGAEVSPGRVVALEDGLLAIGTGSGLLAARRLQLEGKRPADAREFVHGYRDFVGTKVGE